MAIKERKKYGCHALIDGNQICGKRCWGKTAYCRMHNASLFWFQQRMLLSKGKTIGMPFRAPFDPDFTNSWSHSSSGTTINIIITIVLSIFICTFLIVFGFFPLPQSPREIILFIIIVMSFNLIRAMYLGNTNLLFPRIQQAIIGIPLFFLISECILKNYYDFNHWRQVIFFFIAFTYVSPILPGPILQKKSDIYPKDSNPPWNIGDYLLKSSGIIICIILLNWKTIMELLQSNISKNSQTAITNSKYLTLILFLLLIVSSQAAVKGSLSSIKREWHREDIYSKCIRPFVSKVITIPMIFGEISGLLVYSTINKMTSLNLVLQIIICSLTSLFISYFWAKSRGKRIYTMKVYHEGY